MPNSIGCVPIFNGIDGISPLMLPDLLAGIGRSVLLPHDSLGLYLLDGK